MCLISLNILNNQKARYVMMLPRRGLQKVTGVWSKVCVRTLEGTNTCALKPINKYTGDIQYNTIQYKPINKHTGT